jgi:hypothetical protein
MKGHCDECGWSGDVDELGHLSSLDQEQIALSPGDIMPGLCPKCGAVAGVTSDLEDEEYEETLEEEADRETGCEP